MENNLNSNIEDNSTKKSVKHSILIKPNEVTEGDETTNVFSNESWTTVVKNSIKPSLKNIPVDKTMMTRKGTGIIFFPDEQSRNAAADNLKKTCHVEVQNKNMKNILPKLKISGIPKEYFENVDKNTLRSAILEKNVSLQELVTEGKKVLDVIFVNDEKDDKYCYGVIKVDEHIKNAIISQGMKIYIGLSSCRVSERYHLLQCYQCQEFGHKKGSLECTLHTSQVTICLYCSGNHASKDCQVKKDLKATKCHNCATSKINSHRQNCTGHTSTSTSCPILQQALKAVMNRTVGTSYRVGVPKNSICT